MGAVVSYQSARARRRQRAGISGRAARSSGQHLIALEGEKTAVGAEWTATSTGCRMRLRPRLSCPYITGVEASRRLPT